MDIPALYDIFQGFPAISTDSRQVIPGSLFFALKGDQFDGNRFAPGALENGAARAIVDDPGIADNDKYIVVDNVLATLQQLAAFHRKSLGFTVLAITGTNGKTTTKELTAAVLASGKIVDYTRGNLNNHIGVPMTLLAMNDRTEIGIVEMGANHPGEIDFLCRIADPDYGLITNIGKAHLEGFGDFDGVVRTKSELYRFLESKEGTIFINGDNQLLLRAAGSRLKKICYGENPSNWMQGELTTEPPFLSLRVYFPDKNRDIKTKLAGDYNFENVLAAITIGRYFGIGGESIVKAIENYIPSNNRSQWINAGSNAVIMDAYNANPSSMEASIWNFIRLQHDRKLLILGDMLELGPDTEPEHQKIINILRKYPELKVFLIGKHFGNTQRPSDYLLFSDTEELNSFLTSHPVSGSLILVKGSHGIRLDKIRWLVS